MIIGIDASRAVSQEATGTEVYSRQLVGAMLRLPSPHRFRLYFRSTPSSNVFPSWGNSEVRPIPFPRLWTHARLSFEMLNHSPDVLFVPAHVLPLVHPKRCAVVVHDVGYLNFPSAHRVSDRLYLDLSTRWNLLAAERVFAVSQATADDLRGCYKISPQKLVVSGEGYDSDSFHTGLDSSLIESVRSRYHLPKKYLLSVGTLHPRKNHVRLLSAFSHLARDTHLVLVGRKGWLYESIFQTISRLGLEERVRYLSYVPSVELPAVYSGATALIFPSLYEGFGLPVLEAQACGVPVLCSNTSSLPEVAGNAALFFNPSVPEEIFESIRRLLGDDSLRAELVANGLENVKRFSWDKTAKQVHDELIDL